MEAIQYQIPCCIMTYTGVMFYLTLHESHQLLLAPLYSGFVYGLSGYFVTGLFQLLHETFMSRL